MKQQDLSNPKGKMVVSSLKARPGILNIGLGKEREYFIENLSMLISSGMPIVNVLAAMSEETQSRRMKKVIANMNQDIEAGYPLWESIKRTGLFAEYVVSLIKIGERSGKLTDNLKVVA